MEIISSNKKSGLHCILLAEESKNRVSKKDFDGSEYSHIFVLGKEKILLIGVGKKKELNNEKLRRIGSVISDICRSHKQGKISIDFEMMNKDYCKSLLEGILLGDYRFTKYKKDDKGMKEVTIMGSYNDVINETKIICENVNYVRDVINDSPNTMNTDAMEKIAKQSAKNPKIKLKILNHSTIKKEKLNLIDAVGKGAKCPPRLVIMEYNNNPKAKKVAIIGKGITFDSGGINLKPSGHIEDMKCDKSGAMSVMMTMKIIAELKMNVNVVGVMPFCENIIGPESYKPGDYVVGYDGTTVEVGNTDAEGRLVLGDSIAYTIKKYKPDVIVDLATLTGSVLGTFGNFVAAYFTDDKDLGKKLFDSGEKTYERIWELPMYDEYVKDAETPFADVSNVGNSRYYGAINGALFLKKFVKKTKWAHIDIGGTAYFDKKNWYNGRGATGWGVRFLLEFLKNYK